MVQKVSVSLSPKSKNSNTVKNKILQNSSTPQGTSSQPADDKVLMNKQKQNDKKARSGLWALEPPELESFIFSDYSEDDDFEDSRETQNSDNQSDEEMTVIMKRHAASPLSQEDFKRAKTNKKICSSRSRQHST